MIKVFSFTASCAGEKSTTARYSDALAEVLTGKAEAAGEHISYERMTGADLRIEFCRSCNSCFTKGVCPLDKVDDMAALKQKFLEADIILFGSPVYLGEMSGLAKCVLDRVSYWAHRFELAGKVGFAFSTTSRSFGMETAERLKMLLSTTGLTLVRPAYAVTRSGNPNIYLKEQMEPELDAIAEELLSAWRDPTPFVTPVQEAMFLSRNKQTRAARTMADLLDAQPWNEFLVWEARKMAEFPSFSEIVVRQKGRAWDDRSEQNESADCPETGV